MEGRFGRAQPLRLDDRLGHLVPPGQLVPADLESALVAAIDSHRYASGLGVPSVPTRFTLRLHPADRAWLPPDAARTAAEAATAHADRIGLLLLDGITVRFETDLACDMGTVSVHAGYSERDLVVLNDPAAAATAFAADPDPA